MSTRGRPGERGASTGVHLALLRGVNVGGKNALPMKDLAAMVVAAGCEDVATLIQSGNVVFRARAALARRLPAALASAIEARFGHRPPVLLRTAAELEALAAGNPFLARGVDPGTLHVAFLADAPAPDRAAALDPRRSPGDALVVRGREVHLHLPGGVGRTRLTTAYLDATLGTTSTVRSWRTVLRLLELARALGP